MTVRKRMGATRNYSTRGLKLIEVRRTEAHTPIDSHAPRDSTKFFPNFFKFLVDYHDPGTMAQGLFRILSLHKRRADAEEAIEKSPLKDSCLLRLKELKSTGWTTLMRRVPFGFMENLD